MSDPGGDYGWELTLEYPHSRGMDERAAANRQALIDAYTRMGEGYAEPFFALLDKDVVFHEADCLPYGGEYRGIEAVREAFGTLGASFAWMRAVHHELLAAGDYCIAYITVTFELAASGRTGSTPLTEIFRFEGDRIVEWRVNYFDVAAVAG